MRAVLALALCLVIAGCASPDTKTDSDGDTQSGTGSEDGNATTRSSSPGTSGSGTNSSSGGSTAGTGNATGSATGNSTVPGGNGTGNATGNATGNQTAGVPDPVAKTCTKGASFSNGVMACTADIKSSTGGRFTTLKATMTSSGVTVGSNSFVIKDGATTLGTASGTAPLVIEVPADKIPTAAEFTLTAEAQATGTPDGAYVNWSMTVKFELT